MKTPHPAAHDDTPAPDRGKTPPELACRLANVEWAIIAGRGPYRTHTERLHALEAAGTIPDEVNFPRIAAGLPR